MTDAPFRPMRRFKQQLPDEEALAVLRSAKRGVLSVTGDGGRPYGIPLNPFTSICRRLARRFYPDEAAIEEEIRRAGAHVLVFDLVPEHITGKRVHEA